MSSFIDNNYNYFDKCSFYKHFVWGQNVCPIDRFSSFDSCAPMSDMEVYRLLGSRAATRRKQLGLNQEEVAKQIGLSRASLANLETGRQKILLHHVYKLAAALELRSIMDLIPNALIEIEPVNFAGDSVSEQQKTTLEDFVRRIGKKKS